jgi:hypothetical protein
MVRGRKRAVIQGASWASSSRASILCWRTTSRRRPGLSTWPWMSARGAPAGWLGCRLWHSPLGSAEARRLGLASSGITGELRSDSGWAAAQRGGSRQLIPSCRWPGIGRPGSSVETGRRLGDVLRSAAHRALLADFGLAGSAVPIAAISVHRWRAALRPR